MKTLKIQFCLAIVAALVLSSCTKEPSPDFSFDKNNVSVPVTIIFANQSIDADSYTWDFGDGAVSTDNSPAHLYTTQGEYNVTLRAKNGKKSQSITKTLTLLKTPTTYSIFNGTTDFVINGLLSYYYDPIQEALIDKREYGTLLPNHKTLSYETTHDSRSVFFTIASNTLVMVKYPYALTENTETTLGIYDSTLLVGVTLTDNQEIRESLSVNNQDLSLAKLAVSLSGSRIR